MGQDRIRPLFHCHVLESTLWNMPDVNNSSEWARSELLLPIKHFVPVNFFPGYHICSRGLHIFLPTNRQRLHIGCRKGHIFYQCDQSGELAQMVERSLSMWEVGGSIPPFSKLFLVFSWEGRKCRKLLLQDMGTWVILFEEHLTKNGCIVRESNPGRPRGRRAFYHWTNDAGTRVFKFESLTKERLIG